MDMLHLTRVHLRSRGLQLNSNWWNVWDMMTTPSANPCVGRTLLQWSYTQSNGLFQPLGRSWLVSSFYLRLHGPGHWLQRCFSALTALGGSDLNTSNNSARTSATAVEDWRHNQLSYLRYPLNERLVFMALKSMKETVQLKPEIGRIGNGF